MKNLTRPALDDAVAKSLKKSRQKALTWEAYGKTCPQAKARLKEALLVMQKRCCAYCEGRLTVKDSGFIEHFLRRSEVPAATFDWGNLFVSCGSKTSCGIWKDSERRCDDPALAYRPDGEENLSEVFLFLPDGRMAALHSEDERAKRTIRLFNLNDPRLCNCRRILIQTLLLLEVESEIEAQAVIADFVMESGFESCVTQYVYERMAAKGGRSGEFKSALI